jgi:hypothetical protein
MIKNYLLTIFFCCFVSSALSQEQKNPVKPKDLESIGFYPNPVSNGKIYITSKSPSDTEVMIYDVLGKKMLHTMANTREVSIANLPPGVYVIQIKDEDTMATRKLIVK